MARSRGRRRRRRQQQQRRTRTIVRTVQAPPARRSGGGGGSSFWQSVPAKVGTTMVGALAAGFVDGVMGVLTSWGPRVRGAIIGGASTALAWWTRGNLRAAAIGGAAYGLERLVFGGPSLFDRVLTLIAPGNVQTSQLQRPQQARGALAAPPAAEAAPRAAPEPAPVAAPVQVPQNAPPAAHMAANWANLYARAARLWAGQPQQ